MSIVRLLQSAGAQSLRDAAGKLPVDYAAEPELKDALATVATRQTVPIAFASLVYFFAFSFLCVVFALTHRL